MKLTSLTGNLNDLTETEESDIDLIDRTLKNAIEITQASFFGHSLKVIANSRYGGTKEVSIQFVGLVPKEAPVATESSDGTIAIDFKGKDRLHLSVGNLIVAYANTAIIESSNPQVVEIVIDKVKNRLESLREERKAELDDSLPL